MRLGAWSLAFERWLEAEREQLPLWLPVMIGAGVAAWMLLPGPVEWRAALCTGVGIALAAVAGARGGRGARAVAIGGLAFALGVGLIWARSERVAAPVLAAPTIATFDARVERVQPLSARELTRVTLAPLPGAIGGAGEPVPLPPHVRVNVADADMPAGIGDGAILHLRARLMPPPAPAVPGAYDFARIAWFGSLGATGRAFTPIVIRQRGAGGAWSQGIRVALSQHIMARLGGSAGGIASALATGDVGGIAQDDADAMRRAGLAHLLAVSGLHISAAVGLTMAFVLRLLALSPALALRVRLPFVAGIAGAAAAIGYTLLTGAQVPTIRSCVAALLVLVALAMGREAVTLRSVAAGATVVLLLWPDTLAGPSFQLSFAAITAIVALHEHPRIAVAFGPHEEGRGRRMLRGAASLLLTGAIVEFALMPIAVYHFHRAGIYGAVANIAAIPLTTLVVMPVEAFALLLDTVGLGAPLWWIAARALHLLLWIAHTTADTPGSVAALPAMPNGAYAAMIGGGLWIALWRTRWRRLGIVPLACGALWAIATPPPDLLVTGDGRHVAIRLPDGTLTLLRDRAGDYTRDTLAENAGFDGDPLLLSEQRQARCSRDLCIADLAPAQTPFARLERVAAHPFSAATIRDVRPWRIVATRSAYQLPTHALIAACRDADIVISDRGLPRGCKPRWLYLDRFTLARTGGIAISRTDGRIETVRHPGDQHPWRDPPRLNRSGEAGRTVYPAHGPGRERNAADHRRGWRDRAGSSRPPAGNI